MEVVCLIPAWNSEMSVSVGASTVAKQPYIISHRGYTQHWRSINARRGKASCIKGVLTQSVIISWIAFFICVSKVIIGFALPYSVIVSKFSRHCFNQSWLARANFPALCVGYVNEKELNYPGLILSIVSRSPWLGACIFGTALSHTELF